MRKSAWGRWRGDFAGETRVTYFVIYECWRCGATEERPTAAGLDWMRERFNLATINKIDLGSRKRDNEEASPGA